VAYGTTSRIVKEAMSMLAEEGIKTGLIRPISLWPYPYKAFAEIPSSATSVICVELSQGQMIDDVKIGVNGKLPVSYLGRFGGAVISAEEVVNEAKKRLGMI
jgi:2-oxoglutarate ferredoxin oxidoreductase subunit alpha